MPRDPESFRFQIRAFPFNSEPDASKVGEILWTEPIDRALFQSLPRRVALLYEEEMRQLTQRRAPQAIGFCPLDSLEPFSLETVQHPDPVYASAHPDDAGSRASARAIEAYDAEQDERRAQETDVLARAKSQESAQ